MFFDRSIIASHHQQQHHRPTSKHV
ncbi:unnamed protein product, partial [Rotaria sordida]